jgi:hypothetical protein
LYPKQIPTKKAFSAQSKVKNNYNAAAVKSLKTLFLTTRDCVLRTEAGKTDLF